VELELEALLVAVCAAPKPTVAISTVAMVAMKRILSQRINPTRFGREKNTMRIMLFPG